MKRHVKKLPLTPVTAHVEKFSHDGRGIARIEGKTTFIQQALPDETVTFHYLRKKRDYDEGQMLSVLEASVHRVEPKCPHYEMCGGCSLQHLDGPAQIREKQNLLLDVLERIGHLQPETILPPLADGLWNYRNKARLSVRYVEKKQAALVGFREKNNPRYIAEIQQCPVLNARVDAQISPMRAMLDTFEAPQSIAQIEVAAGDDDVALIIRNLSELSSHDQEKLREFSRSSGFRIFLQPGGMDSVYLFYPEDDRQYLSYELPKENIKFQFLPTDFTQINAGLNRLMVDKALALLELEPSDTVLDLFCGLGNFSLPIARRCAKVIGVEGSDAMVARAQMNADLNGLTNTAFFCANLDDESAFESFNTQGITKMLIDPPRLGAMAVVKQMHLFNPQRLVYVSCNPATLARDADILVHEQGYKMLSAGVMDMFPHTAHVESIAVFERG